MSIRGDLRVSLAAVGGTFDLLHKGHRRLLDTAFSIGDRVIVGLSDDNLVKMLHKPHRVENYNIRKLELQRFLRRRKYLWRAKIIPLNDRYGPTVNSSEIRALIVSRRSQNITSKINNLRMSKGLNPLKVVSVDMVLAQDRVPISTTRIRRGKINREGKIILC